MNHSTPAGVGSSGGREKCLYGIDGKGEKTDITPESMRGRVLIRYNR